MGLSPLGAWGVNYRSWQHTKTLNMQIKRLLDDRDVFAGDKIVDAQQRANLGP